MSATHYIGNPFAYQQRVGVVHGITNLFSSLSLVDETLILLYPALLITGVEEG